MIIDINYLALLVLLEGGACVDSEDMDGQSAVHLAVTQDVPAEMLLAIVKRSENLTTYPSCTSTTPLHSLVSAAGDNIN